MSKYDYKCSGCGAVHEAEQSIHDPPYTKCPDCGNPTYYRLINLPNVVFKGSWPGQDIKRKEENNES